MVIHVDITVFGVTIIEGVPLVERNVSLAVFYFGLTLKLVIRNIQNRKEETSIPDIFFGEGFSAMFSGDFTYITTPLKQLFKLEGTVFSILVVTAAAVVFPMLSPPIEDFATFRSFLFKGLTAGYSVDLLTAQAREILGQINRYSKQIAKLTELKEEIV